MYRVNPVASISLEKQLNVILGIRNILYFIRNIFNVGYFLASLGRKYKSKRELASKIVTCGF